MRSSRPQSRKRDDARRWLLDIERVLATFTEGIHRSALKGHGEEFVGLRSYEEGDPFSRIDFVASARLSEDMDELVVREFHPERKCEVVVALDATSGMESPWRKLPLGAAVFDMLARSAFRVGDPVTAIVATDNALYVSPRVDRIEAMYVFVDDVDQALRDPVSRTRVEALYRSHAPTFGAWLFERRRDTFLVAISDFLRENGFDRTIIEQVPRTAHERVLLVALDDWAGFRPVRFLAAMQGGPRGSLGTYAFDQRGELVSAFQRACEQYEELRLFARKHDALFVRIAVASQTPFSDFAKAMFRQGVSPNIAA